MKGNEAWEGEDWKKLRETWQELQVMLEAANKVVELYQKKKGEALPDHLLPPLPIAKKRVQDFVGGLKELIPKKQKKH